MDPLQQWGGSPPDLARSSSPSVYGRPGAWDVIWNPLAGGREVNAAALAEIQNLPERFTLHVTESEEDAIARTAAAVAAGTTRLMAAGGDGVINVVTDTLLKSLNGSPRQDVTFGVLPLGTGNDYARSLGLPLVLSEAVDVIGGGMVRTLDVVRLTGPSLDRYGVNMLAGGNSGEYTRCLTDDVKQQWGPFCFLRGAIDVLQNLEIYPIRVQFDEGPWQQFDMLNLFVANGRCAGAGLPVAHTALLDDGLLDVVIVLEGSAIQLADLALQYVLADHREHELIICRRVKSLKVECATPLAWAIDGQDFVASSLTITVEPGRLPVVVGPEAAVTLPM